MFVLVVEGGKHVAGDVRNFVDVGFILGNGVEARFEDTILRLEDNIAFSNLDVEVGDAVINAVST